MLRPPLGLVRLIIIELVAMLLLLTGSDEAEGAIIGSIQCRSLAKAWIQLSDVHPSCRRDPMACSGSLNDQYS